MALPKIDYQAYKEAKKLARKELGLTKDYSPYQLAETLAEVTGKGEEEVMPILIYLLAGPLAAHVGYLAREKFANEELSFTDVRDAEWIATLTGGEDLFRRAEEQTRAFLEKHLEGYER